jgi:hypothetical protein
MATNTPPLGLRYPDGTEAPNVPLWLGYLAGDVDTALSLPEIVRTRTTDHIFTAATFSKVPFDTNEHTPRGSWAPTTAGDVTVPANGLYLVNVSWQWLATQAVGRRIAEVRTGATVLFRDERATAAGPDNYTQSIISGVRTLTAGTVLNVWAYSTAVPTIWANTMPAVWSVTRLR